MSAGVLIYCFDSPHVQYHKVANLCIELIKQNLKLPVTVVTNSQTKQKIQSADNFVIVENQQGNHRPYKEKIIPWYNLERSLAYEHSPYDTTILMDADYFVYTDNLLQAIKSDCDFMLHDKVHDLTNRNSFDYTSKSMIPIVWATVTIFKKTIFAKKMFEMIKHVQTHYNYFCELYRIDFKNFRNDYAFAIAVNQLGANDKKYFIPTAMSMLPSDTKVLKINNKGVTFQHGKFVNLVTTHDIHVLDKEIAIDV